MANGMKKESALLSSSNDDKCIQEKDRSLHLLNASDSHETEEISSVTKSVADVAFNESPGSSNYIQENSSSENNVCVSKDRLIETIEDKIEQREFKLNELDGSGYKNSQKSANEQKDVGNNSISKHLVSNQNSESISEDASVCSNDFQADTKLHEDKTVTNDTVVHKDNTKAEGASEINNFSTMPSEKTTEIKDIYDSSSLVEEVKYVSTAKCIFGNTSSNLSVSEKNSIPDEEQQRIKKSITLSWDPVPLLGHLYKIKEQKILEGTCENIQSVEGYVSVLPVGAFDGQNKNCYLVVCDHCLYIYETDRKEKLLMEIPLKSAHIEYVAKDVISVDNKLGKCLSFRCLEYEARNWKECLSYQCSGASENEAIVSVQYPIQSHKNVIVIDLGSCSTRAGILMDQPVLPKLFFPSVCATDKSTNVRHYGVEALRPEIRQNSVLSFPVRQSAKITKFTMDIDALKGLFEKIFHELNVDQRKYTIQLCVPRSLSTNTQGALVKLLIEELGVQAVSLTGQALLTLYANNTSTAIVVDIGERMDVMPVVDGFILECGVSKLPHGGQQIIHHLKHALAQKHISLTNDVESFVVRYIAESLCYVAENYDKELQNAMLSTEHVKKSLPLYPFFKDESKLQTITLDIGRFQVPEGLFDPDLWGLDFPGLHKLVHQAIQSSGMDVRRRMAENIYVSGGVTLIPGFVERLENEVAKLTLPRLKPQVRASPYRYHMAYLGACQLAASEAFQQVCVSSKEWFTKGPMCLRKWHL